MVTVNILDGILYILVAVFIWEVLPEDFTEEIGALIGIGLELIWFVIWLSYFVISNHDIIIT